MVKPLPYARNQTQSEPEVFIIESLAVEQEIRGRYEGRALRDSLRITGQQPAYYYVQNAAELSQALELFRHSSYRYLHLSFHGSVNSVFTTLEEIGNAEFAGMCSSKLKNRRVFFSACEVGSGGLSLLLESVNKGMYSVIAPLDKIHFGTACAFWTAFYTKLLIDNPLKMEIKPIKGALQQLCAFFKVRFSCSYHTADTNKWVSSAIG